MTIVHEVVEHNERVAGVLAQHFGGMPLVATYFPDGIAGAAVYSGPLTKPVPASIATTTATTSTGQHQYIACAKNTIEWLAHRGAIELASWAPAPDADRRAYARLLVHPSGIAKRADLHQALELIRERINHDSADAIALVEARGGALWIPIADAPTYDDVAGWLHTVATDILTAHPALFSNAPLAERGDRFYLGTSSNHPGRFSALPYSATGEPGYTILIPTTWENLETAIANPIGVEAFPHWWQTHGDLFSTISNACVPFELPPARASLEEQQTPLLWPIDLAIGESRGPNIRAALAVLADGKPRTSDEIVIEASKLGLLAPTTPARQLYTALIEYIARARGVGRVPQIVQDPDRRFRLNEPADDWPNPATWKPRIEPHPNADALVSALRTTGGGMDGAAFELAVCDALTALGFIATHVGGQAAPDAFADAPLGTHAYRVVFECKTARGDVANPDVAEAAKYREAYGAQFAALIGPAFPNEQTVSNELQTHNVSAWTIDDVAELLAIGADLEETRALFAPGFVDDRIATIRWNREHGIAKRVAVVCETLITLGWRAQQHAPNDAQNAALLTEDAAMMLVDGFLAASGAPVSCSREYVVAAFSYLTSPIVEKAMWAKSQYDAIIILVTPRTC